MRSMGLGSRGGALAWWGCKGGGILGWWVKGWWGCGVVRVRGGRGLGGQGIKVVG